jgi:hypothetical protein
LGLLETQVLVLTLKSLNYAQYHAENYPIVVVRSPAINCAIDVLALDVCKMTFNDSP